MTNPTTDLAARFEAKRDEELKIADRYPVASYTHAMRAARAAAFSEAMLLARDMARAGAAGGAGERVRHLKRGTEYEVLGEAEAQVSVADPGHRKGVVRHIADGDRLMVYRGSDGKLWTRFTDEFRDGRFETIAAAPPPPAQQGSSSDHE